MQPTPMSPSQEFLRSSVSRPMRSFHRQVTAALTVLPLVIAGCRDPKVTTYTIPKEAVAELPASAPVRTPAAPADAVMPSDAMHAGLGGAAASNAMPQTAGLQTASGDGLAWVPPADWSAKPAGGMRKATYVVSIDGATAELAVTAFPGDVGGEVANVNRWRGQVGLGPVSDADAQAALQRIEANGLKIGVLDVFDAATPNAAHLLGAMVPYQGATWFFKLLGPDAVVSKAKPAFLEFVKTVKPAAP